MLASEDDGVMASIASVSCLTGRMGAMLRRSSGVALAAAALLLVPAAGEAAVAHPGNDYDLDGSPDPVPAALTELDIYTPDNGTAADSRPVVVYVHGGGWKAGDKANRLASKVALFTGAGYVFASVNYRLSPDPVDPAFPPGRVRFPDHPRDVGEAVAWIDANVADYGGDPTRILLIGHSAGAHLVSLISTDPAYVEAFGMDPRHLIGTVPLDTDAYDLAARIARVRAPARPLFYSAFGTPAENGADDTWANASPIAHATMRDPEFMLVTQAAAPVRLAGTREMAVALGQDPEASVFAAPYDHAGINDAVGAAADPAGETAAIMTFFERMVAASQTSRVRFLKRPPAKLRVRRGHRAKVRFRFEAAVAAASYECRLDDAGFRRCSSPATRRVGRGRHAFRVRAVATNGEAGPANKTRFRVKRKR